MAVKSSTNYYIANLIEPLQIEIFFLPRTRYAGLAEPRASNSAAMTGSLPALDPISRLATLSHVIPRPTIFSAMPQRLTYQSRP